MTKRRWRPAPFIVVSAYLHAAVLCAWLVQPGWGYYLLAILVANHLVIAVAGLWPRSTLLGANLIRLPAAAAARGEVAITIDDGPDPAVTPQVLAILARYGARASFFCIGERALAHPELVRSIVAGGHRVENHGQHHRNHVAFSGLGGWLREVGEAQATLAMVSGQLPSYYRALAGLRNPFLDVVLQRLDVGLATWTRRGYDTRCQNPDEVLHRLTRDLAAGDILLLHDGHAARTAGAEPVILAVLPRLLEELACRGLRAVSLPVPRA